MAERSPEIPSKQSDRRNLAFTFRLGAASLILKDPVDPRQTRAQIGCSVHSPVRRLGSELLRVDWRRKLVAGQPIWGMASSFFQSSSIDRLCIQQLVSEEAAVRSVPRGAGPAGFWEAHGVAYAELPLKT